MRGNSGRNRFLSGGGVKEIRNESNSSSHHDTFCLLPTSLRRFVGMCMSVLFLSKVETLPRLGSCERTNGRTVKNERAGLFTRACLWYFEITRRQFPRILPGTVRTLLGVMHRKTFWKMRCGVKQSVTSFGIHKKNLQSRIDQSSIAGSASLSSYLDNV